MAYAVLDKQNSLGEQKSPNLLDGSSLRKQIYRIQSGMFLASRGEHVLVHETAPERSDAFNDGNG
ncbi:MAG: hypothetical protein ACFFA5_05060 [Promethearchaeota archaeon]